MAITTPIDWCNTALPIFRMHFRGYGRFRPFSVEFERQARTLEDAIRSVEKENPELSYAGCTGTN